MFKPAKLEMAYLKMGIYGEAGSGKTFTASKIAIGLHRHIKATKPVFFFDTETGSDFVLRQFENAGVELFTFKSKSFVDLKASMKHIEKEASVGIIDSISHPWSELMDSYREEHKLEFIRLKDWGKLKPTWREFSGWFAASNVHLIVCGRAADEWEQVVDEEGIKELQKVGTRMRTEREMGYEPSLLVEMIKVFSQQDRQGAHLTHRAWVVKDRFDESGLEGKPFDDPGFNTFLPHIELLNLGGEHRALDSTKSSKGAVKRNDSGYGKVIKHNQFLEGIQNEIYLLHPGQTQESKKARLELLEEVFNTNVWAKVEQMDNIKLDKGYKLIKQMRIESKED